MHVLRSYRFEICWLVLLLMLLLLTPPRVSAQGWSFFDFANDCDGFAGWCFYGGGGGLPGVLR